MGLQATTWFEPPSTPPPHFAPIRKALGRRGGGVGVPRQEIHRWKEWLAWGFFGFFVNFDILPKGCRAGGIPLKQGGPLPSLAREQYLG